MKTENIKISHELSLILYEPLLWYFCIFFDALKAHNVDGTSVLIGKILELVVICGKLPFGRNVSDLGDTSLEGKLFQLQIMTWKQINSDFILTFKFIRSKFVHFKFMQKRFLLPLCFIVVLGLCCCLNSWVELLLLLAHTRLLSLWLCGVIWTDRPSGLDIDLPVHMLHTLSLFHTHKCIREHANNVCWH